MNLWAKKAVPVVFLLLWSGTSPRGAQPAATPAPRGLAIVGATVFDATGAPPRVATVLIADGRIAAVGPGLAIPPGDERIDATGEALLPGFFDLHTHWTPSGSPSTTPAIANADVSAGVTTVNDFNAAPESYAARRAWLSRLVAPHVNLCARFSTPGGHGADWADQATTRWVNTPAAARAGVEAVVPYGPVCLGEVMMDGWRYGLSPDFTSMNEDTLAALVDEAHRHHLPVLTHTVRIAKGAEAGEARVDVIAHALQDRDLDEATIQAIRQGGSALAPTLAVYDPDKPGRPPVTDPDDPRARQTLHKWRVALRNTKRLYDAGVPIALGTDAGMPGTPHGQATLHEMELLVQAGLPPAAALIAGTANSARAMGLLADRGTIEPGKRADLVLIKGTPWVNIDDVQHTDRVFIDGALVFGPGAPPLNPVVPPTAVHVAALVADFERPDGRTNLDTLVTTNPDGGLDRSVELVDITPREDGGHALTMVARMSVKPEPEATVILPLTRGSVVPADLRPYHGVMLDIRGDGAYELELETLAGPWVATITGGARWQTVRVPFDQLTRGRGRVQFAADGWTGDNVTDIAIEAVRHASQRTWLEIDNVRFY